MPCGKLCLHHHCQRLNYGDGEECSIAHHDSLESGPFSRPAMPRWGSAVLLPRCGREACVGNEIRDGSTTLCVADQTNLRLSPKSFKTDQIDQGIITARLKPLCSQLLIFEAARRIRLQSRLETCIGLEEDVARSALPVKKLVLASDLRHRVQCR